MEIMVPEIDGIVNFHSPEVVEEVARDTGFVQRESKLGGMEFLKRMLSRVLELSVSRLIDVEYFGKVHLLDSSQTSLPGTLYGLAVVVAHLMLDYKSGRYEGIAITDGISPDQNYVDEAIERVKESC